MKPLHIILVLGLCFFLQAVNAQRPPRPPRSNCTRECPTNATLFQLPNITQDENYRYIETSACPPYDNPNWNNPNRACVQDITYRIPKNPRVATIPIPVGEIQEVFQGITYLREDPSPILGSIGVWVNGVNVYGVGAPCGGGSVCPDQGAPTIWVDAVESEGSTLDMCGGHPSPSYQYHIHAGFMFNMSRGREVCRLPSDTEGEHSELLAWMFDGFGLYGQYSLNGVIPDDLDNCGGHTHEINGVETYHYHLPGSFPWIIGCFKGCPEVSNNPRELGFSVDAMYGCSTTTPPASTGNNDTVTDSAVRTGSSIIEGLIIMLFAVMILFL